MLIQINGEMIKRRGQRQSVRPPDLPFAKAGTQRRQGPSVCRSGTGKLHGRRSAHSSEPPLRNSGLEYFLKTLGDAGE